jgi:hypothetical protein
MPPTRKGKRRSELPESRAARGVGRMAGGELETAGTTMRIWRSTWSIAERSRGEGESVQRSEVRREGWTSPSHRKGSSSGDR